MEIRMTQRRARLDHSRSFGVVNDRLCREFPNIQTDDLIALYREAGERQMAEAEELEKFARMRRAQRRAQ